MRIARIAVVAASVAAGVAVAPASAHMQLPRAAAGETVIRAAHSGAVDLTLRDDARIALSETRNPDIDIAGPGRLTGFYLYRVDGNADAILALRLPASAGSRTVSFITSADPASRPTCTSFPTDTVSLQETCTAAPPTARLHEGVYRLVVLTDGAPVTVTLHLHGLSGRRVFRPASTLASGVTAMTLLPNPSGSLARGRAVLNPTRSGLLLTLAVGDWTGKPTYFGSYGCTYTAGDPVGDQMPPDCPGGSGGGGTILDPMHQWPSHTRQVSLSWSYGVGAARYTVGQGLEGDSGVSIVGGVAAWVATPGAPGAGGGTG